MGSSRSASTSTDPLFTKELPPPPENESSGSLATTPLAGHQSHLAHSASALADADTDIADGAVITGAESFWPSVDTDDSDTPPDDASGSPLKRKRPKGLSKAAILFRAVASRLGRTFDTRYQILPNDQVERERNKLQHRLFLEIFQGKLHLAPVRDPTLVLDLGASPGIWALEFAKQYPNSKVLGVDLEVISPQLEVPNCRFRVMDITDAWKFQLQFDFVHLRMLGELPPLSVIESVYENLAPGGWAEFTEWVQVLQCPNHSVEGTAFEKWDRAYQRALNKLGRPATFPHRYKGLLKKAGFRRIHVRKYAVPLNAWPNSKSLQRIGSMTATNYLAVIDILSRDLFVHVLGWKAQDADALISQVRNDIQETSIHIFYTLLTVYAQKPYGG